MISTADKLRFERACLETVRAERSRDGIGRLAEKRLHTALKLFACPDISCHEVRLFPVGELHPETGERQAGYIADVLCGNDIYEVQTGALGPLVPKIKFYLEQTEHNIIIIHPLTAKKWVNWLDPKTSEISERNSSPGIKRKEEILPELFPLLSYLGNRRLTVWAPSVEVEEFRIRDGRGRDKKKGATRYDKVPTALLDMTVLSSPADYLRFVPENLPDRFTATQFGRAAHYYGIDAYSAVKVLRAVGVIRDSGMLGRAAAYELI